MKKLDLIFGLVLILIVLGLVSWFKVHNIKPQKPLVPLWGVRSIDTVKYSRDISREKLNDPTFYAQIDKQVANISSTGATHVALGTPYDGEFIPILTLWVKSARAHNLKVWFRGNFSGWEGWFNYPKIDRQAHLAATKDFITKHKELFADGDIFSACPECENGGPGDPRTTRDVSGARNFLIDEYKICLNGFSNINIKASCNFDSMNYDVATLIMDKDTTKALGGVVVIDHYVKTPEKLKSDIEVLATKSGGKIVLGEFGVPIPDINGKLTESEQADWLEKALSLLSTDQNLIGLNYWVNVGGSTELWDANGNPKKAVVNITKYYSLKK